MTSIKINGYEFSNVSSVESEIEYDYHHDVATMDGKIHRSLKGKRTNYTIEFGNKDFSEYDALKNILLSNTEVQLEVPNSYNGYQKGLYFANVEGDILVGKLMTGGYYNTGLTVFFEKVGYDE